MLFSNAWAGYFYYKHEMGKPSVFAGGADFDFLVSDGSGVILE